MRHNESIIQQNCVKWFRLQYPELALMLFAVPNGGLRRRVEAAIMKAEGMTAGVADLILLVPSKGYNSLCIEMKTEKGRQTDTQKQSQKHAERHGNKYVICRSFEQFVHEIRAYLL
jgi:hypothetical protein